VIAAYGSIIRACIVLAVVVIDVIGDRICRVFHSRLWWKAEWDVQQQIFVVRCARCGRVYGADFERRRPDAAGEAAAAA
jgi:hypothetical protein